MLETKSLSYGLKPVPFKSLGSEEFFNKFLEPARKTPDEDIRWEQHAGRLNSEPRSQGGSATRHFCV